MFPSVILTFFLEVRLVSGAVHQRGDLVSGRQVHPSSSAFWLISAGPSPTTRFFSVTVPDIGLYTSLAAFTDSKAPHSSPAAMVSPGSGSWAYTTSPRASAAYLDMPTVPFAPSTSTHSCFLVKKRSSLLAEVTKVRVWLPMMCSCLNMVVLEVLLVIRVTPLRLRMPTLPSEPIAAILPM